MALPRYCHDYGVLVTCLVSFFLFITSVGVSGFSEAQHEELTSLGLPFLRSEVEKAIINGNLDEDDGDDYHNQANHFDSCSFEQSSQSIRAKYQSLISAPIDRDPFRNAFAFGEILHPSQDFYSHSNWVELQTKLNRNHIVSNSLDRWPNFWAWGHPPSSLDLDIRFIEYAVPDGISLGSGITPSINDGNNGEEFGLFTHPRPPNSNYTDDRCPRELSDNGLWHHAKLNKDDGDQDNYQGDVSRYNEMYQKARRLSVFQTNHEFCRYLNLLKSDSATFDKVSIPVALWLDQDMFFSGHSSCSGGAEGSRNVTVSITNINIKNDLDDGSDPGDLNLVFVFYTGDLKRSVRTQVGPVEVGEDSSWPVDKLPSSLSMCINPSVPLIATVQGWDDERGISQYEGTFNSYIPNRITPLVDADQVLKGITIVNPTGSGIESESEDIVANFDVSRTRVGCPNDQTGVGNNNGPVMDFDSDFDGIPDSSDNCVSYPNPLQKDSDGDGIGDACDGVNVGPRGTENTGPENPREDLLDSDDDGVLDSRDNCPNSPNRDQNDRDDDGIGDACEIVIAGPLIGSLMNATSNRID